MINPKLMKKGLHVTFLDEIMLSPVIWSHPLGPAGALLAMPTNFSGPKIHGETCYGRGWCVGGGTGLIGGQ